MPKNRQGRINDEVREALSDALRSIKDPRVSGIVSIIRCEVTGDMRYCKTYISVMGTEEQKKSAMAGLKSASGWLRRELSQRIDLRYTPEVILVADNSIARGAQISEILNQIHREEEQLHKGRIESETTGETGENGGAGIDG